MERKARFYMSNEYYSKMSTKYVNKGISSSNKPLPELYKQRENCCGCSACYAICSVNAIIMEADEEGFLYPTVDAGKCIRCYKCLSVCVFKVHQQAKGYLAIEER